MLRGASDGKRFGSVSYPRAKGENELATTVMVFAMGWNERKSS